MRILFVLPGLHRHNRGAEVAFIAIATELCKLGEMVTLLGSGPKRSGMPYKFIHSPSMRREQFEALPKMPVLRHEYAYEELSFVPGLWWLYRPDDYDITVTCSYPFTNWLLRMPRVFKRRPPHVYVTQNGDWPAIANNAEFRFFGCEGLVCTNPEYYDRNKDRWRSKFIPNGVDLGRFSPGPPERKQFGLPTDRPVVLMVSALISSKRVETGIEAVSLVRNAHLVVAGDGPLRDEIASAAARSLPGRFSLLSLSPEQMPSLYRSADVFLLLSKDEPSSLAFVEALACGLPVVAHEMPRIRYIAGNDEFLLDTENPADVAQQIERALSTPMWAKSRAAKVTDFAWSNIAPKYRDFLAEIVKS